MANVITNPEGARQELRNLRQAIRNGFFAWPGGYQMRAIMADGETMCCKCARDEYRRISDATRHPEYRTGWELFGVAVLWEGAPELCCNCTAEIPSAYGEPESN